jgi:hypothetical protein
VSLQLLIFSRPLDSLTLLSRDGIGPRRGHRP